MKKSRAILIFIMDSIILLTAAFFVDRIAVFYKLSGIFSNQNTFYHFLILYVCTSIAQIVFGNYFSLWRYAQSKEYLCLLLAAFFGFLSYEIVVRTVYTETMHISFILLSLIASLWVIGMLFARFIYRYFLQHSINTYNGKEIRTVIIGAGQAGVQLYNELRQSKDSNYKVLAFFDDSPEKIGYKIYGLKVYGPISNINSFIVSNKISEVILAIPSMAKETKKEILSNISSVQGIHTSLLPSTAEIISGQKIQNQLRDVAIEDLLGRDPVKLDSKPVMDFISNKIVMVTGGGGSIGSELCRQVASYNPQKLVIVDIYENNAYAIEQELKYKYPKLNLDVEIASVRDRDRMEQIFINEKPQVVFHAAAHKHVPLMEHSEMEAIKNNVFGTKNVSELAGKYNAIKFILISTDKAVNPTNVMGASKRLCEMVMEYSASMYSNTTFAAVRFGNVLGSNGSVVPLFKEQIAHGGPVTITDKRIVRYFMTIPEAVSLVLTAGVMAKSNELFVLDMGKPVKILTLAENLIKLSGHTPNQDIMIEEIGLRPGEKLFEELLISPEKSHKTENDKIFVEDEPSLISNFVEKLDNIYKAAYENSSQKVRELLHELVPTYIEKN